MKTSERGGPPPYAKVITLGFGLPDAFKAIYHKEPSIQQQQMDTHIGKASACVKFANTYTQAASYNQECATQSEIENERVQQQFATGFYYVGVNTGYSLYDAAIHYKRTGKQLLTVTSDIGMYTLTGNPKYMDPYVDAMVQDAKQQYQMYMEGDKYTRAEMLGGYGFCLTSAAVTRGHWSNCKRQSHINKVHWK